MESEKRRMETESDAMVFFFLVCVLCMFCVVFQSMKMSKDKRKKRCVSSIHPEILEACFYVCFYFSLSFNVFIFHLLFSYCVAGIDGVVFPPHWARHRNVSLSACIYHQINVDFYLRYSVYHGIEYKRRTALGAALIINFCLCYQDAENWICV